MRRLLALLSIGVALCACSSSGSIGSPVSSLTSTTSVSPVASGAVASSATATAVPTLTTSATSTSGAPSTPSSTIVAPAIVASTTAATPASTTTATTNGSTDGGATTPESTTAQPPTTAASTAARPYDVFVPSRYSAATPMPLVILLHGYGASGTIQEAYFHLQPLAESKGFLYVHPDGTKDQTGRQFWNATEGCCNFGNPKIDDSAYLAGVIHDVEAQYNVDPKRIYLVGHSNGGFMSYRMACDHADVVAAIVSLAGATFDDPSECKPSQPVSVLEIHGNADETIRYDGGQNLGNHYPSAATTVRTWAGYDGCKTTPVSSSKRLDLAANLVGNETSVSSFPGCADGVAVQLWTVDGGPHIPSLSSAFAGDVIDFLFAHPKA